MLKTKASYFREFIHERTIEIETKILHPKKKYRLLLDKYIIVLNQIQARLPAEEGFTVEQRQPPFADLVGCERHWLLFLP